MDRPPIFGEDGRRMYERAEVPTEPGLFVGLPGQFAVASDAILGMARGARYVVKHLTRRSEQSEIVREATPLAA